MHLPVDTPCSRPPGKPCLFVNSKDFPALRELQRIILSECHVQDETHPQRSPVLLWLFASSVPNL